MQHALKKYLNSYREAAPLAVFRILFGLLMAVSILRFWSNGWIEKLYLEPQFFFSYYGFEWVQPLGTATYGIFAICFLSAVTVAIGWRYRLSMVVFFLSFSYIELMDKTTYLNHYYFISILSFLMLWLPAAATYSVDAWRTSARRYELVPSWTIDAIKVLLTIVYVYAGLAKLNSDWLLEAMPLKIWLPSKFDIPLIGPWITSETAAYLFSWSGALYDLCIPFLLWNKRTRLPAFILVVIFHVLTRVLFPIGMFPYIMIGATLIFFSEAWHLRLLQRVSAMLRFPVAPFLNGRRYRFKTKNRRRVTLGVMAIFFMLQILMPFRYVCYPGELFWTEEGYRFSWRVMLMEKAGYAQFKIVDQTSGKRFYVDNSDFLTPFQEKQMSTQVDFILEYAHYLAAHFSSQGHTNLAVYVDSHVVLNGRRGMPLIPNDINLLEYRDSFKHKSFITPFHDTIQGF